MAKPVNYQILDKDIPFGETVGIVVGKAGAGVALAFVNPVTALAELAGAGEGFFGGIKTGIEVTRAKFSLSKTRGEYNSLKKQVGRSSSEFDEAYLTFHKLKKRISELPENLRDKLFPVEQEPATVQP